jgi:transposase
MTPEKLFHELLGLGLNWEVAESRFDASSGTVYLEIKETSRLWDSLRCPKDGGLVFCYDHTETLSWRHLNVFQHRCEITCRLPRGKCRQCGHVFRVAPPWEGLSTHFSKEFEAYALLLLREMPVAKVAEVTGESDTRLWRMIFKHVDGAYAQADFTEVCGVGVDEMGVGRQEYISIFADLAAKRVIFATEGRGSETWEVFVQALEAHHGDRRAITDVTMDMSAAYEKGVKENCRNAQVVFDKFHVLANASQRVDKVRRAEVRLDNEETRAALRQSQWLWRKNPQNLSPEEQARLAKIKDKNLCTAKAYQMRLVLQDIYRTPDVIVARRRFKIWCRWVRWVARRQKWVFKPMVKLAQMVENHLEGILAHWKGGLTNAFMEGLISVFSAVKRKARGYRSPLYLITMLYFVFGKLRLPHACKTLFH